MFWLWLIVAILILAVGSYVAGVLDLVDADEQIAIFWCFFFGALMWPFVLVIAIIVGPFAGLYWLGNRKREKLKEKSADNK